MLGLILMAGRGSRFGANSTPKPLIGVEGYPMFYHAAISVLNFAKNIELAFCVSKDHEEKTDISTTIRSYFPKANVVVLPGFTTGPAESAHKSLSSLIGSDTQENPIMIMDCDFRFKCRTFENSSFSSTEIGLLTFKSTSTNYSYLEFDQLGQCLGCIEKVVMSDNAVAGLYFFRSSSLFQSLYKQEENGAGEFFMSKLINRGIQSGLKFAAEPVLSIDIFGTPQDLAPFTHD